MISKVRNDVDPEAAAWELCNTNQLTSGKRRYAAWQHLVLNVERKLVHAHLERSDHSLHRPGGSYDDGDDNVERNGRCVRYGRVSQAACMWDPEAVDVTHR